MSHPVEDDQPQSWGGSLEKSVVRQLVDTGCERELLWSLGGNDPRWLSGRLKPIFRLNQAAQPDKDLLLALGSVYEQRVYQALTRAFGQVEAKHRPNGEVTRRDVTPAQVEGWIARLSAPDSPLTLALLEHSFDTPQGFLRWLLDADSVDVLRPSQCVRPDIILAQDAKAWGQHHALRPGGHVERLDSLEGKVALVIMDVKYTSPDQIRGKHLSELLFYMHALAWWLRDHGLDDRCFVALSGHGIIPFRDDLMIYDIADLDALREPLVWENHAHLFDRAVAQIRAQRAASPQPIERAPVRIQSACARCVYLDDCMATLGHTTGQAPSPELDVRLMPYTSAAVAEALRQRGIHTVGQLDDALPTLDPGETPSPLHAPLPMMRLKTRALLDNMLTLPAHTAEGAQHLSVALPRYADMILALDVEADPTHERVFAFGMALDLRCAPTPPGEVLGRWWRFWREATREGKRKAASIDPHEALSQLDAEALAMSFQGQSGATLALQLITRFAAALDALDGRTLTWDDDAFGHPHIRASRASVNTTLELHSEARLTHRLVRQAHALLTLVAACEALCGAATQDDRGEARVWAPSSMAVYWSKEQIDHARALLERHLHALFEDDTIREPFSELLMFLTPEDSNVHTPYHFRKFYDLREFVETSVGVPTLINTTWHGVARYKLNLSTPDRRFWHQHFNYMDFTVWHAYLKAQDTNQVTPIEREIEAKCTTLARLTRAFQRDGRDERFLTHHSAPYSASKMADLSNPVPATYNFMARAWALFERLTAGAQEQATTALRLSFPMRGVAALQAAIAADITPVDVENGPLRLWLRGLSTHVRMGEGDHVLLMPRQDRERVSVDACKVVLELVRWDSAQRAFEVIAKPSERSGAPHLWWREPQRRDGVWMLYSSASSIWGGRLYNNKDSLLGRDGLGASWLGERAAFLLGVLPPNRPLRAPEALTFGTPELYVYAPELLPSAPIDLDAPLLTTAHPAPDASQRAAIQLAMASALSCVQGPPGTGKSQTIAALIDELILRRPDRPVRVLVTAFSYAAMQVVLSKVRAARDVNGAPTRAARTPLVFCRSETREPIPDVPGLANVIDLCTLSSNRFAVDGHRLDRRRKSARFGASENERLEHLLPDSFIMFANAHTLYKLRQQDPQGQLKWLRQGFAFDLIIIDEASQMPVDHALASLSCVRQHEVALRFATERAPGALLQSVDDARDISAEAPLRLDDMTRVVIVGDHHQLPPVQPVKPPERLRPILDSLFSYYMAPVRDPGRTARARVRRQQLTTNYRSRPEIVAYTSHLNLYDQAITAARQGAHAWAPLPEPPAGLAPWLSGLLHEDRPIHALIHHSRFDSAVSELEARLVVEVVCAFMTQLNVRDPQDEARFWREDIGIVSPHNAQGRLITRALYDRLTDPRAEPHTTLSADALMGCLRETIYSVEKFQGSDRTFIIATMGVSSEDQLWREEAFLYDITRHNVLTSRAKQKMLLVCSQNYLDHVPRDRQAALCAARARDLAFAFCAQSETIRFEEHTLQWRWHDPTRDAVIARDATMRRPDPQRATARVVAPPPAAQAAASAPSLREAPPAPPERAQQPAPHQAPVSPPAAPSPLPEQLIALLFAQPPALREMMLQTMAPEQASAARAALAAQTREAPSAPLAPLGEDAPEGAPLGEDAPQGAPSPDDELITQLEVIWHTPAAYVIRHMAPAARAAALEATIAGALIDAGARCGESPRGQVALVCADAARMVAAQARVSAPWRARVDGAAKGAIAPHEHEALALIFGVIDAQRADLKAALTAQARVVVMLPQASVKVLGGLAIQLHERYGGLIARGTIGPDAYEVIRFVP